ncbi:MAG: phosphotransferase, partial [Bifidobacteriaceae bacterium]|nr:phosphotransferase [Bifidobacteriaceae bacterium]
MGIHRTDPLALAALATAAVPGLDLVATRLDQLGADFAFAEVDDASGRTWIVRMPLHDAAEAGQEAELTLLKALAGASSGGALPFEVPRPRGSASFDGGGVGIVYPRLPGVPVVMELMPAGPGIAESLGRAIAAFHQLPPAVVTEAGMPALTPSLYRHRLMAEVADAVRTGHVSERLHNRWREQLERDDWWVFTPVPIHGDMAPEHLLHHSDRISAMADFASVQVSDPAEDLAQILAPLPPDLAGTIVGAYRARRSDLEDPHLEDRAAFLGEIAIIRWLQHGLALGDEEIVRDARHMLADLDRAVREELEAKERAAAVEAAARARLEEAKLTAERESQERRDAAARASRAAAREHERNTGSQSASPIDAPEWRRPDDADRSSDPAAVWLADPSATDRAGGADGLGGPPRKAVSDGGVSVWGKPRRPSAEQDAGEEPGLGGGGLVEVG